jgi:hypothetical protein
MTERKNELSPEDPYQAFIDGGIEVGKTEGLLKASTRVAAEAGRIAGLVTDPKESDKVFGAIIELATKLPGLLDQVETPKETSDK